MKTRANARGASAVDYSEAARMLMFLRAIGTEDQRIAYAVLEGMHLQKRLDEQRVEPQSQSGQATGKRKAPAPA